MTEHATLLKNDKPVMVRMPLPLYDILRRQAAENCTDMADYMRGAAIAKLKAEGADLSNLHSAIAA